MSEQVSREQFDKILGYIKSGQEEGAKLETGGKQFGKEGYFVEPTVFSSVKDHMKIAREEIFGPVQSIFSWSTLDEVGVPCTGGGMLLMLCSCAHSGDFKEVCASSHFACMPER